MGGSGVGLIEGLAVALHLVWPLLPLLVAGLLYQRTGSPLWQMLTKIFTFGIVAQVLVYLIGIVGAVMAGAQPGGTRSVVELGDTIRSLVAWLTWAAAIGAVVGWLVQGRRMTAQER